MKASTLILANHALRHGGIQAAVRACGAAPSSVSTALKCIEKRLSVQLLRRGPGGSVLTAEGTSKASKISACAQIVERIYARFKVDPLDKPLTLENLFRFADIVEAGSIRRAARRLETGQPVMSRNIRHLEEVLGCKLLTRMRGGTQATSDGSLLFEDVIELQQQWWDLTGGSNQKFRRAQKMWHLGCVPPADADSPVGLFTAHVIAAWVHKYDEKIFISSDIADTLLEGLELGKYDAIITDLPTTAVGFDTFPLAKRALYFYFDASRHDMEALKIGDILRQVPLALPSNASGLRHTVERYMQSILGERWLRRVKLVEIDSLPVITELVRSHGFCSFLPQYSRLDSIHYHRTALPEGFDQKLYLVSIDRLRSQTMSRRIRDLSFVLSDKL